MGIAKGKLSFLETVLQQKIKERRINVSALYKYLILCHIELRQFLIADCFHTISFATSNDGVYIALVKGIIDYVFCVYG